MPGPLSGIKVLDFTTIISGPFCCMMLSDMGADVIKVEAPPDGDPWRGTAATAIAPGEARTFISLNRGKRGIVVDLSKEEGKQIIYQLIPDTDVVVVNFRPDVAANLGMDYEMLASRNPRLVYCDNTAFGREGPIAHRPGYDIVSQAVSGLATGARRVGEGGMPALGGGVPIADFASGALMMGAICAALYAREVTGKGQMIQTNLLASALAFQTSSFTYVEQADRERQETFLRQLGEARERGASYEEMLELQAGVRQFPRAGNIYYRFFQTRDGHIAVGNLNARLRKKMADALGVTDPRNEDPTFNPLAPESQELLMALQVEVEALMLEKTTEEWLQIFDEAGVPAGPVKFIEELFDDPQVLANDLVVELDHSVVGPIRMVGPVFKMSDTPTSVQGPSPALGQHTDEVLASLGYDEARIARLRESGVVK